MHFWGQIGTVASTLSPCKNLQRLRHTAIFSKFIENLFVIIFMFRLSKNSIAIVRYERKCPELFFWDTL